MPTSSFDRHALRLQFARQHLYLPTLELESASSDASFRSYWRTVGLEPSFIIMDAPPPNEDLRPWIALDKHLAEAGIHVPRIHSADTDLGLALIEDLGSHALLPALNPHSVEKLYDRAMRLLLDMQMKVATQNLPPYNTQLLHDEMALFILWFVEKHIGYTLTASDKSLLDTSFDLLVASALEQPRVFVHRDFHSRNLMLQANQTFGLIDFQDALEGPVTYDLVSLLRDCYIRWDNQRVEQWCKTYHQSLVQHELIDKSTDAQTFKRWFDWMGLQRHIKVLGIFARLAIRDHKHQYLDDLPRVLAYVLDIARLYPELADFVEFIERLTATRDVSKSRFG